MNSTQLLSLLGSLAGVANYGASIGIAIPSSKQEWLNFIVSLLLAVIGILAKGVSKNEASPTSASS